MDSDWRQAFDLGDGEIPAAQAGDEDQSRAGVFSRLREGLARSRRALGAELAASVSDRMDEESWERIEEALILADVGAPTTAQVVRRLEDEVGGGRVAGADAVRERLIELLAEIAGADERRINLRERPAVIMVTGVNGTGKTTTIGKIAWHLRQELGLDVIVAAADTYRAAAVEQLAEWAERAGCEIVRGEEGGDPGAVAFDAVSAAQARG